MEKIRPSTKAWAAILGGVAIYDVLAPHGETLSERIDDALNGKYKWATHAAVATVALHLCNMLPEKADPIHHLLSWKGNESNE